MNIKNNTSKTGIVRDIEVKTGVSARDLVKQFKYAGFQASNLADAVSTIREMRRQKCTVFLSFTANMVASGLRGVFADFIRRGFVDAVITTGGSVDHDIIRVKRRYLIGTFNEDDVRLHRKEVNRLGNILIPNERYVYLERWVQPLLEELYAGGVKTLSPREFITYIGKNVKDRKSILYQCCKRNIPVFSPGITDSALGLQLFFFKQEHKDFVLDVTADMGELANLVLGAEKTGGIVLGGGISKHYLIGVNLLRGGLDYSVYITTASPFDGSLSGAVASEAKSWGKISERGRTVVVYGDASIVFPLIFAGL